MSELDLGAVRAFVAVAECGHFGDAAVELGISQQAVSKRVAKLEAVLGVALLARVRGGVGLSAEGETFLSHARRVLDAAEQAVGVFRGGGVLRVDVIDTRLASTDLVRRFHRASGVAVDVVTSVGLGAVRRALREGSVDAAFAWVNRPLDADGIVSVPVCLEPVQAVVGARHPFVGREWVRPEELAGFTAWMPGNARGTEWAEYYEVFEAEFGVRIDARGPNFGFEDFLRRVGESDGLVGFVGESTRIPDHPGVRRVWLRRPQPVYPWSLLWHRRNRHSALPALVGHVRADGRAARAGDVWMPPSRDWATAR